MSESNCPDKVCPGAGLLSSDGRAAESGGAQAYNEELQ
jgi:hypothetical protein